MTQAERKFLQPILLMNFSFLVSMQSAPQDPRKAKEKVCRDCTISAKSARR